MFFRLIVIGLLTTAACASLRAQKGVAPAVKQLQDGIKSDLAPDFLDNSFWGILVQSLKNGETLYSLNPKRNLVPASNRKIFTSIFDLDKLGPDFEYTTKVYLQGRMESDTSFAGNVIVRGMGDPSISGRFNDNKITRTLEDWADSLRARHIKIIHGKIIGDDNFFGDDILGSFW